MTPMKIMMFAVLFEFFGKAPQVDLLSSSCFSRSLEHKVDHLACFMTSIIQSCQSDLFWLERSDCHTKAVYAILLVPCVGMAIVRQLLFPVLGPYCICLIGDRHKASYINLYEKVFVLSCYEFPRFLWLKATVLFSIQHLPCRKGSAALCQKL